MCFILYYIWWCFPRNKTYWKFCIRYNFIDHKTKKQISSPTTKTTVIHPISKTSIPTDTSPISPNRSKTTPNTPFSPNRHLRLRCGQSDRLPLENPLNPASSRLAAIGWCIWRVRTVIRVRSGRRTMGGAGGDVMTWHSAAAQRARVAEQRTPAMASNMASVPDSWSVGMTPPGDGQRRP